MILLKKNKIYSWYLPNKNDEIKNICLEVIFNRLILK